MSEKILAIIGSSTSKNKEEYFEQIADAIIAGKIPHVKYVG